MFRRLSSVRLWNVVLFASSVWLSGRLVPVAGEEQPSAATPAKKVTYAEHVQPIFRAKCFGCHNLDKKSGGLDLTSYTALMQGGSSGTVVEPGDLTSSYLYDLVSHQSEPKMPPNQERMGDDLLTVIREWIEGGALENSSSTAKIKKPKFELALSSAPTGKPEGPPPMPERLSLQPVVHTARTTAVASLATNPWSPLVAVAGQKQVLLYHSDSLDLLGVLPFPEGVPHVLKFSQNGSLLLAAGGRGAFQGTAVVFDVKTGERVTEVGDEVDAVLGADLRADHTMVAIGSPSKMVRVYSTATGEKLYEIKKHTDWVTAVAFSPDGVLLATGDRNGGLHVWEADTGRPYLTLNGHTAMITGLSWRGDSNVLASASEDTTIKLWEMQNGSQVKNWGAHGGGTADVEFTRDGRLVSCGRDNTAKLWDQNGTAQRSFEAFGDLALRVTYCDETNRVIAGDWTGEIRVWNAADGTRVGQLSSNPLKLEDRLSAAAARLAAQQAEQQKLAAAANAAQQAAEKIQADLNAANQTAAQQQTLHAQATTALKQHQEAAAKLQEEQAAAEKAAADLQPAIAQLGEAAAKAQEAAAKAPEDKALADAAAALKTQLEQQQAELAAARKTAEDKKAAVAGVNAQITSAQKQIQDSAAALKAAQEQASALTAALKPAAEQAAAARQQAEAAAAAVANAQKEVARWTEALEFEKSRPKEVATN